MAKPADTNPASHILVMHEGDRLSHFVVAQPAKPNEIPRTTVVTLVKGPNRVELSRLGAAGSDPVRFFDHPEATVCTDAAVTERMCKSDPSLIAEAQSVIGMRELVAMCPTLADQVQSRITRLRK